MKNLEENSEKLSFERFAGIAGAVVASGIAAEGVCREMYARQIPQNMYSESILVRTGAKLEALPYEVGWVTMGLPGSLLIGGLIGVSIARNIKKLTKRVF